MRVIRKMLCSLIILTILLAMIPVGAFAADGVSINPIPDKHPGDSVTISGNTTFSNVSIKVLYPNGDQYNIETVESYGGAYSYTFKLSSDLPYGTYIVVAGNGDITSNITFSVGQQSIEEEITINPIPDKHPGDSVTISGNTTFSNVSIKVLYPNGDQYNIETVESYGGAYSYIFKLSSDLPSGIYTVIAGRGSSVTYTEFEVISADDNPEDPEDPEVPENPEDQDGTEDPEDQDGSENPGAPGVPGDSGDSGESGAGNNGSAGTGFGDKEPDNEEVDTEEIIKKINELNNMPDMRGKALEDAEEKLIKELERAAYMSMEQRIKADIEGSKATVKIDELTADSIISTMDDIVKAINEINKQLEDNGIEQKLGKKLKIHVETNSEVSLINTEIPSGIFDVAEEKGIEAIEIISDVASFELPPSFIEEGQRGSTISISAAGITLDEEEISKLSESQRQILEKQNIVYDFTVKADGQTISQFNGKVTVRIKYELKTGEDKDNITVLYLADDGTIKNMSGKYDEETGEVVFSTDHFSLYCIKNLIITFSDVAESFWAKGYIGSMASKGIINGMPDGSYNPGGMVTRAEFAKMITVAMGIVDDNAVCSFSDINKSQWHYKYVASATNAGIIKGKPGNIFAPDDKISRQEMAVMVFRALGEKVPEDTDILLNFNDWKSVSDWAKDGLAAIIESAIMNGKPGSLLDPTGYSTRAEAAAVIYRVFNY